VKNGTVADAALIEYMRECIARVREYTGLERARFDSSHMVQDAVVRNLQTLTESSQRLSAAIKAAEPQVPWRELSGFRNILVHGYLGVDLVAVWAVIEQDLPVLDDALQRMAALVGRVSG
jgi:uncharacterized protein with HEPN domain